MKWWIVKAIIADWNIVRIYDFRFRSFSFQAHHLSTVHKCTHTHTRPGAASIQFHSMWTMTRMQGLERKHHRHILYIVVYCTNMVWINGGQYTERHNCWTLLEQSQMRAAHSPCHSTRTVIFQDYIKHWFVRQTLSAPIGPKDKAANNDREKVWEFLRNFGDMQPKWRGPIMCNCFRN